MRLQVTEAPQRSRPSAARNPSTKCKKKNTQRSTEWSWIISLCMKENQFVLDSRLNLRWLDPLRIVSQWPLQKARANWRIALCWRTAEPIESCSEEWLVLKRISQRTWSFTSVHSFERQNLRSPAWTHVLKFIMSTQLPNAWGSRTCGSKNSSASSTKRQQCLGSLRNCQFALLHARRTNLDQTNISAMSDVWCFNGFPAQVELRVLLGWFRKCLHPDNAFKRTWHDHHWSTRLGMN